MQYNASNVFPWMGISFINRTHLITALCPRSEWQCLVSPRTGDYLAIAKVGGHRGGAFGMGQTQVQI